MFVKVLHGGNFAACFGTIATAAADLTVCGGAATGISAILSGLAILKKDKPSQALALQMGEACEAAITASPLPPAAKKLIPQLMQKYPVTEDDIAAGRLIPKDVATIVKARIKTNKQAEDPALTNDALLDAYEAILTQMLSPVLAAPAGLDPLQVAIYRQLLAKGEESGATDKLRDEGITEKAIIRLAQRIAADTGDVGQAWLDLQNAMDIAVNVQREGARGSNHADFVDEVLARVAELTREGEYASASDAIKDALKQEEAESAARKARLLDSGVEVALLEGDTERAADLLIRKADVEAGGRANIAILRALQDHYYVLGRDKGLNLQGRLAIDLARAIHNRAETPFERGATLDDLAVALNTLGERDSRPDRLEQAIDTYRVELDIFTQEKFPKNWATTQNNLGAALQALGERAGNPARLEQAVAAYEAALTERTQDRVPLDWAMTQNNLGTALWALGERAGDTARLEQAVAAYREALKESTRDRAPLSWAATQNNLGNALQALGERAGDTARLEQAVAAYEEALKEWTQDRVPLQWAGTQNNLGIALRALGERAGDPARLEQAVAAYEEALKERTQDSVPLDWAMTQANLADVYRAQFDLGGDPADLDRAARHVEAALEVFVAAGADHYVSLAEAIQAEIAARRG